MIYGLKESPLDGTEMRYRRVSRVPERFMYALPPVLDQGSRPICVPCSLSAFLNWNANLRDGNSARDNHVDLMGIFRGGGGGADGMSFKGALEYLKREKAIREYGTVGSELALKTAVLMNGPCAAGMVVRDGSKREFWEGGQSLGGHAVAVIGWTAEGFLIRNSWGKAYGEFAVMPDFGQFTELWTMID